MKDRAFAFQVRLELHADAENHAAFLARPDIRGLFSNDWDDEVADLQYRECGEYSVGHNVSSEASFDGEARLDGAMCRVVRTCWVPRAEVERVEPPASIPDVELGMRAIAGFTDGADAWAKLAALPRTYRSQWIDTQRATLGSITEPKRRATAQALLNNADSAARRIERGIELLRDDAQVLLAFRLANRAMADAAGQRRKNAPPNWFPFQLAFVLMNLEGIANPESADRSKVDLLFFPTGGGKTEALPGTGCLHSHSAAAAEPGDHRRWNQRADAVYAATADAGPTGAGGDVDLRDGTDPADRQGSRRSWFESRRLAV
jgi:hypothetical protein